ncbi:hypothetical protein Peur_057922 [Populus x canadensis]
MNSGGLYQVKSSLPANSSSIWRNNGMETFSRSSREEDDEEALKWAAIERPPTYSRLRKGLLTTPQGEACEIDIHKLGFQERKNLMERVGIEIPTVEVRFEHLNVETEVYLGSRALPTIFNSFANIVEVITCEPGPMTLLLGPPGSGKTTLLLALAGKLPNNLEYSGRVTYNGHEMNEFVPQRTAAYISQHDLHLAEMTVRETLSFSARCQGTGARYEMLAELLRREKAAGIKPDPDLDVFMKFLKLRGSVQPGHSSVLGLEACADTMLGDELLRGVSGGQKKRVTTGEMLVGSAKVLLMDEISTGLDSSTTFQIMNSLKQCICILNGTAFISLLQPVPETYDLFDDIILLSDGHIVYQVKEFSEAFQSFHVGRRLGNELAIPFERSKSHPSVLTTEKYGVNKKELLRACFSRELLLMKRNSFVYIFKLLQLILMALIGLTLFIRTQMHRDSIIDGGIYMGALFFILVMIMFNGMSEIGLSILKLPVFYKQRDLLFYPTWAYALPTWILKIPITIIEVAVWVFITYYTMGFDPNVERLLAAVGRNLTVSSTMASFVFLMLFTNCGFVLSRENMKKWFIWGYWISPMMYGEKAMAVNEFLGKSWSRVLPFSTEPLGVVVLKSRGFFTEAYWYWIGVGALIGFTVVCNFAYTAALTCLDPLEKLQGVRLEESPGNKENDKAKRALELLSQVNHQNEAENQEEIRKRFNSCRSSSVMSEATTIGASQNKKRGMILPFEQNFITFDEITYSINMPQSLLFSAWLRLPVEIDNETRKLFIEEVMELVELTPLREALVGLPGVSGLSTEQRKRLTIAVELVANPSIIFMDEPTTGLDARAAAIVMRTFRNTVDTGRTVVCTIHQASIDIFESFDELFLLKQGGQEIYVGPVGHHSSLTFDVFVQRTKEQDLLNAMGSMYTAVLFLGVQNSGSVQPVVSIERTVFYRERAAGMYSAFPYAMAQVVVELPYLLAQAVAYSIIVYSMIGFEWTVAKFFWYLFYTCLTLFQFTFFGMMAVGVTPNHHMAAIVSTAFYSVWNLFSGFMVPVTRIPVWWRWFYWACPIAWTLYGLLESQYGDRKDMLDIGVTVDDFMRKYFSFRHDFLGVP